MTLCYARPSGATGPCYGRIVVPDIASVTAVSPYDIIQQDLSTNLSVTSYWFCQTVFRFFFRVTDFDPLVVSQTGGALARYKFGAYTVQNADCNYPVEFLNYVQQTSSRYITLITNLDKPVDPVFEDCSTVDSTSRLIGTNTPYPSYAHHDYVTDIIVQPAPSVTLDLLCIYSGNFNLNANQFTSENIIYLNF